MSKESIHIFGPLCIALNVKCIGWCLSFSEAKCCLLVRDLNKQI